MMENKNKTNKLRDLPRRLWARLGLIGLLLGLALVPAAEPPAARAQTNFECADVTEIPLVECQALVALYVSTDGPNWDYQGGWLQSNNPCGWYGVSCEAGRVIGINLSYICPYPFCDPGVGLSGSLPPEIGNFSRLESLYLSYNALSGTIPAEIGNLTNLVFLGLSFNGLSGSIPPEIGNLTVLVHLSLSRNSLSGSIPAEIGNLTNLETLDIYENQLSGSIPAEIGNLTNLETLELNDNQLTGSVTPEIGNLSKLREVNLSYNQLTSLPPEIGNLSSLVWINLCYNQLINLPPEIGGLSNLESLFLYNNLLADLPSEIGQLSKLRMFDLSTNRLHSLPPEIGMLTNLQMFSLNENHFTSLPSELGNLSNLGLLELSNNQLTSLPAEFGNLSELREFYLTDNQLISLPNEFGNLSNLNRLELSNNQIISLPNEFGNLSELRGIDLADNQLTSLPAEFGNLSNLNWLELSNNQLTSLPPEIGYLSQLSDIWLSDNKLTMLPPEFGRLSELWAIYLTNNSLSSLPPEFGNLSRLHILELSNNQLASLPPEFGRLSKLGSLNLDNNQLTGLPHEFSHLKLFFDWDPGNYLLDLSNNRLSISDPALLAYLNTVDPDWADTQTIPPTDLQLRNAPQLSLELAWTPIRYSSGPGFYELSMAEDPAGPYTVVGTTPDKTGSAYTALRLSTQPAYYFRMRTFSAAHDAQLQDLWSAYTPPFAILYTPVNATTTAILTYTDAQNQTIQVEVPAGAVSRPGTLYLSTSVANQLLPQSALTGQTFTLGLYQGGAYTDDSQFSTSLTLTLTYQEDRLVDEHLRLVYWDPSAGAWREAAQTCSPSQTDELSPVEQQMVVPVCRLGTYALVTAQPILYLPAIRQSQ